MPANVFVVSEWLPKPGKEEALFDGLKHIVLLSRNEPGCIRAHITKQVQHPGAPTQSEFPIVLLQELMLRKA